MKLVRVAATLAAACFGTLARGTTEAVSLYSGGGAEGDHPFNLDAAQQLLGSMGGGLPTDDAGLAVQQMLLTGEVKPASMHGLTTQIGGMVTRMTGEVMKSHKFNKKELRKGIRIINKCRGPRWRLSGEVWTRGIGRLTLGAMGAKKRVDMCRLKRNAYSKLVTACIAQVNALREARDALCKDYITTNKLHPSAPDSCIVGDGGETQHQWVQRLTAYVRKEQKTLLRHQRKCNRGEKALRGPNRRCNLKKKELKKKTHHCNVRLQAKLVEDTCKLKSGLKSMCATYRSCYKNQVMAYDKIVNRTKTEVVTRKLQWRMLKRLECLVGAYDLHGGKIDKAKLDSCVAASIYGTVHLNIAIPPVPDRTPCSIAVPAKLRTAIGGAECKPTTTTTTTTAIPKSYWTTSCNWNPAAYNLCKPGYTQKGQEGADPSYQKNRKHCCKNTNRLTGRCLPGFSGWNVKCELADSPSGYLSGRCTNKFNAKKQCHGAILKSGDKEKDSGCFYRRGPLGNGPFTSGYMAVCKVR